jgi:hypothetical protein
MLYQIMRTEKLKASDIDGIEVSLSPYASAMAIAVEPTESSGSDHRAPLNASFDVRYVLGIAAAGVEPGAKRYAPETISSPLAKSMRSKVKIVPNPGHEANGGKRDAEPLLPDPDTFDTLWSLLSFHGPVHWRSTVRGYPLHMGPGAGEGFSVLF